MRRPGPIRNQACRHAGEPGSALEAHQQCARHVPRRKGGTQVIPAAFEYARASSVDEAAKLLNKYGEDAKVLAGGHSLIPLMRLRLAQPSALVDINGIKDLDHIKEDGQKLRIGALTRHVTIQNSKVVKDKLPLLAEVAGEVGDNQVGNSGTVGGGIAHADAAGDHQTLALIL